MPIDTSPLPLPPHFDAANAARWDYSPDQTALFTHANEWRREHQIPPAGQAPFDLHLLLVDVQRDFCFPEGTLYVGGRDGRGALGDNQRIAEFIYHNLGAIKNITTTMDTHYAFQIFFAPFWQDGSGAPIAALRTITTEQIRRGDVRPNPDIAWWIANGDVEWLQRQALFYCEELEREGKYELYLWPPHCILGSAGHALAGVVHEARMFQSFVRGVQSWVELKGGNPFTENYSVLRPEVLMRHDGLPLDQKNARFIKTLIKADAVVVAGEAASHCVKSTIDDLLNEIAAVDRKLVSKVYVLEDCMSAVAIPDGKGGFVADFTPQAEEALARFADAGMHVVRSTDPIESWPGLPSSFVATT